MVSHTAVGKFLQPLSFWQNMHLSVPLSGLERATVARPAPNEQTYYSHLSTTSPKVSGELGVKSNRLRLERKRESAFNAAFGLSEVERRTVLRKKRLVALC